MTKLKKTTDETKKLLHETIEDFGQHFTAINNEISANIIKVKEFLVERLDSIRQLSQLQRATQELQEIRDLQNSLDEVLQSFDTQNEETSIKLKKIVKLVEKKQTEQKASINTAS
ncbi:unnamed protein product, partial [Mesorhabditis belari]|uniref:Uncharacterized protein n=1 Tax=Mesorhabditis belari TaxID=2138241 RepID=A0AAF3EPA5_9BILA